MEKVIIKLQEEIFHQGEYIERLSTELYAQQKEIVQLRKQLQGLSDKFESVSNDGASIRRPEEETPPPHY